MNIREVAQQFCIFIYTDEIDKGALVKVTLAEAGYGAHYFQEEDAVVERISDLPPHIVVFFTRPLRGAMNEFIGRILEVNPDVRFIVLSNTGQFEQLTQYNSIGVMDILSDEESSLELRVLWSIDRACEKIYLALQSQEILAENQKLKEAGADAKAQLSKKEQELSAHQYISQIPISVRLAEYRSAASRDDLINKFLLQVPDVIGLFYKYLPQMRSLLLVQSSGVSVSQSLNHLPIASEDELRALTTQLSIGECPEGIRKTLYQVFEGGLYKIWPLYSNVGFEGIFAFRIEKETQDLMILAEEYALFQIAFNQFVLEKRIHELEVQDSLTGLYNRGYYIKRLNEELARARRTHQPLSLLKLALDNFFELESTLGRNARDAILKRVSGAILSSSRSHDIIARTGENEISVLLPSVDKQGAIFRAERLRRQLEKETQLGIAMNLSVSFGVSEYPTLVRTSDELDNASTKAMMHIYDKGGNRICLYKAPPDFVPEFVVTNSSHT